MWRRAAAIALLLAFIASNSPVWADDGASDETSSETCAENCYIGADGSLRDSERAYRRLTTRGEPKYLRTWIEMALALGSGTAWYWIDRDRQVADWDFPSVKQRVTFEAWRFDNNPFDINFFWHTFNGMGFHVLARSNELSLAASTGVGLVTSLVWEIGLEFREKVSVNDVITTTGAGVASGEFLHWFGRYINSGRKDNALENLLRWTFGAPRTVHNLLDKRLEYHGETDKLGFNADIWHQFNVGYAVGFGDISRDGADVSDDKRLHHMLIDARLAAIPGYLRPGKMQRFFAEGNVTSLDLRATFSGDGVGVDFRADTMLVGLHAQNIPMPEQGGLGTALTVGAGLSYHYRREKFFGWKERLGLMHLPGLAVDGHLLGQKLRLKASARLHVDFAGINALSYPDWKAANPDAIEKTILRKHGYYYAWGLSGRGSLEIAGPRFNLGASIFYGSYDSQEDLDRTQEEVTDDVQADDRVFDYNVWLRVGPVFADWYIGANLSRQARDGNVGGFKGEAELDRIMVQVVTKM